MSRHISIISSAIDIAGNLCANEGTLTFVFVVGRWVIFYRFILHVIRIESADVHMSITHYLCSVATTEDSADCSHFGGMITDAFIDIDIRVSCYDS